jgi:Na+-transporting NADH:ubiquinone oxidoreductase subunit NqrF
MTNGHPTPVSSTRWLATTNSSRTPNLQAVEFYLCGPPAMIHACTTMLATLGVHPSQITSDEF